jgi:chemotaxis family two-component system response regulator Rcp1
LVDDNDADVGLVREALEEATASGRLHVVGDGENAMAFLRRQGIYTRAVRPDLILLDLNLPRKHGREVLAEIKADNDLRRIPVVILTSSHNEQEVVKAYEMHANCYIVKPFRFDQFIDTVKAIEGFWFRLATLPQPESTQTTTQPSERDP